MRNSGYSKKTKYESAKSLFIDGNTVRRVDIEEVPLQRTRRFSADYALTEDERRKKQRKAKEAARALHIEKQKNRVLAAFIVSALALLAAACLFMISAIEEGNTLKNDINELEAQINELSSQNDSREYDINANVNLDDVIKSATEELGMVRGSADQIQTYKSSDSEYIQQLAEIPQD